MDKLSLVDLTANFNKCWPNYWMAEHSVKNFGKYSCKWGGEERHWSVDREQMMIRKISPRNPDKVQNILVYQGEYPNYNEDYLTVDIDIQFGTIADTSEETLSKLSKFILERSKDLRPHLDRYDDLYPIKWSSYILINDNEDLAYSIKGKVKIPLTAYGEHCDIRDMDELCKLLLEGFYSGGEHPNDIDEYLYLNEKGLINDSWSFIVKTD